jgi:hypothetical protein
MHRVLKKKGKIFITTPFLYRVHGSPDDFFRPTPSWYNLSLKKLGFSDIKIIPLFWGPFSMSLSMGGVIGPLKRLRMINSLVIDYIYFLIKKNSDFNNISKERAEGFFIIAKKK